MGEVKRERDARAAAPSIVGNRMVNDCLYEWSCEFREEVRLSLGKGERECEDCVARMSSAPPQGRIGTERAKHTVALVCNE